MRKRTRNSAPPHYIPRRFPSVAEPSITHLPQRLRRGKHHGPNAIINHTHTPSTVPVPDTQVICSNPCTQFCWRLPRYNHGNQPTAYLSTLHLGEIPHGRFWYMIGSSWINGTGNLFISRVGISPFGVMRRGACLVIFMRVDVVSDGALPVGFGR